MHYFFLQGDVDSIATIDDAIRFDSLDMAKNQPIAEGKRAVIIMTEDDKLEEGFPYPYHLAWYYSPACGWQQFDEQEALERGNSRIGNTLFDCED